MINYTNLIPDAFYWALAAELLGNYGPIIFSVMDEPEAKEPHFRFELELDTGGWNVAVRTACRRTNCDWLEQARDSAPWYEYDAIDQELAYQLRSRLLYCGEPNKVSPKEFNTLSPLTKHFVKAREALSSGK